MSEGTVGRLYFGRDDAVTGMGLRVSQSRDFQLLDLLIEACQRLLRQSSRLPLPGGAHEQVSGEVSAILSNTAATREHLFAGADGIDAFGHVVQAAQYLNELAERLVKAGLGQRDGGMVRALIASSRQLQDEIGGGYTQS
ncbi:hypothetical protein [Amycolatopsis sp. NPDC051061]|uniref:hypothetical protein n=1 Tax=Amycolatopsis sp. NPDC051061 TaxID=3155042 RepID=UPI003446A72F